MQSLKRREKLRRAMLGISSKGRRLDVDVVACRIMTNAMALAKRVYERQARTRARKLRGARWKG